jgi:predicted DCC family thiol-disulfide oxidoreductase YuxK
MHNGKPPNSETVVFYDGSCPLCRAEMSIYKDRDAGAICLVDVSDPKTVLPGTLERDQAMARFHVLSCDGRLLSGAAAFVEVWRQLPGWRWAGRFGALPGVISVLEIGYRLFLPLRPAFVRVFVVARRVTGGIGLTPGR